MAVSVLTAPQFTTPSRNPFRLRLQATGFSALENYRVVVTITIDGNALPSLFTYPDASGVIALELSEVIHAHLATLQAGSFPTLNDPFVLNTVYTVAIAYREEYGAPPTPQGTEGSLQRAVIFGGVDYHLTEYSANGYFADMLPQNRFASWWPHRRMVTRQMPNWLAIHNTDGSANIDMEIECFSESGAPVIFTAPTPFRTLAMGANPLQKIGVFPIGPDQLDLPATVISYRVRFKPSDSATWTDWRTYIIDRVPKRINRYLVALNVWGVPETIRCTGRRSKQAVYSPLVVSRPLPAIKSSAGTRAQVEHNQNAAYIYRTGYLTAREVDVVTGLVGIGKMWEVEGSEIIELLPLELNQLTAQTDNEDVYTLDLTMERAMPPRNYSPRRDDIATDSSPYWLLPDGVTPWQTPDDNWEIA